MARAWPPQIISVDMLALSSRMGMALGLPTYVFCDFGDADGNGGDKQTHDGRATALQANPCQLSYSGLVHFVFMATCSSTHSGVWFFASNWGHGETINFLHLTQPLILP